MYCEYIKICNGTCWFSLNVGYLLLLMLHLTLGLVAVTIFYRLSATTVSIVSVLHV